MKEDNIRISKLLEENVISTISPTFKLTDDDIKKEGRNPVVSQDKEYIVGFSDMQDTKLSNPPYIVFGDHTECIKYVKTPFLQGADGIKILKVNNENEISNEFLYYALLQCYNKTGFYERHFKGLRKTFIPLYKKEIQEKIEKVLLNYDDLIENNNRRIQILEDMAEEVYKEWFVRFRFPEYENTEFVDGVPNGWEYKKFSELFKYVRGVSYSSEEIESEEGIDFVNLKNIQSYGGFRRDGLKKYNGKYKEEQKVKYHDLVMGVTDMTQERRTVGAVALVPEIDGVITMDLVKLESETSNLFWYCLFKYGYYSTMISQFGNGANVIHLRPESIKNQKILLPKKSVIEKFINIIEPIFDEIEKLYVKNDNLSTQRDLLLPRLMSGKIDLNDKEIV